MVAIIALNTANYDDHIGWMDRLQFIVDTILGDPNGNGISPGPADVVCLSEIRYTPSNAFYQYASTYWASSGIKPPLPNTANMADMIVALLNQATTPQTWNIYTQAAMHYPGPPVSWEGLSIISRYPISKTGYFSMPSPSDGNKRITQYATVSINSNTPLTVYNTHFALDEPDRETNADLVISTISQQNPPYFVLAGDFNADPSEKCIQKLSSKYTDLWANLNPKDPGLTFAASNLVKRIDYIFASANVAKAATQIDLIPPSDPDDGRAKRGTVFLSDHLGLWANISMGPRTDPASGAS